MNMFKKNQTVEYFQYVFYQRVKCLSTQGGRQASLCFDVTMTSLDQCTYITLSAYTNRIRRICLGSSWVLGEQSDN